MVDCLLGHAGISALPFPLLYCVCSLRSFCVFSNQRPELFGAAIPMVGSVLPRFSYLSSTFVV
jgi:hypothetical protein